MDDTHRPDAANASGNEVPLKHEVDPFVPIMLDDQVKPIQRKRSKLPEREPFLQIRWGAGTLLQRGTTMRLRQTRVLGLLRRRCLPRHPPPCLSRETNWV